MDIKMDKKNLHRNPFSHQNSGNCAPRIDFPWEKFKEGQFAHCLLKRLAKQQCITSWGNSAHTPRKEHRKQPHLPIKRGRQQPQKAASPATVLFQPPDKSAFPWVNFVKLFWGLSFHSQCLPTDIFITKVWVKLADLHLNFSAGGWRERRGQEQAHLFLRSCVSLIQTSWGFELQNYLALKITLRLNMPSQAERKLAHTIFFT